VSFAIFSDFGTGSTALKLNPNVSSQSAISPLALGDETVSPNMLSLSDEEFYPQIAVTVAKQQVGLSDKSSFQLIQSITHDHYTPGYDCSPPTFSQIGNIIFLKFLKNEQNLDALRVFEPLSIEKTSQDFLSSLLDPCI